MNLRRALCAVAVAFSLFGCKQSLDLDAIRSAAASAAAAQDSLDAVAGDLYDSCVRRNVYATVASDMSLYFPHAGTPIAPEVSRSGAGAPLAAQTLSEAPPDRLAALLTPKVAAALSQAQLLQILSRPDRAQVLAALSPDALGAVVAAPAMRMTDVRAHACDESQHAAQAWQSANGIIVEYFVALGQLAGGQQRDDRFGLKALASGVGGTNVVAPGVATAVGNFATTVLANVYDAQRRGALADYIPQADAALGSAIDALDGIATDQYAFVLDRERTAEQRFLLRNLELSKPGADAFAVLSYADAWSAREAKSDARVAAIGSYVATLQKLRGSHAALLRSIAAHDPQTAFAVVETLYASIKPDLDAMQTAFKRGT